MVTCPVCRAPSVEGAAYCAACGAPIAESAGVSCPACQVPNLPHARFCHACAAPLSSPGQADRRVVTVLFADLSGYTQLTERMDPEDVQELIASCLKRLSERISNWGGYVDKFIGDCVMAIFGAPVAYENEAERAIRAAIDMHASLDEWTATLVQRQGELEQRPRLRIGINSGPVVMGLFEGGGARNYTAVGDTVNVASRLEGQCQPGRILVDARSYDQTRHLFEFDEEQTLQVKGRREPVHARHVTGVRAQRGKLRGFLGKRSALIGRAEELGRLRQWWREAAAGTTRICLLTGPAGIGKSRLVEELIELEGVADLTSRGRSYPHAASTPWEPVAGLLRNLYGIPPELAPAEAASRIVAAAGEWPPEQRASLRIVLGAPVDAVDELRSYSASERREQVRAAITRALFADRGSPRLLVLEDLHWADRATIEYLTALPELKIEGPHMVVLVSRPSLPGEDILARLLAAVPDRTNLAPLSVSESLHLIDELLESHELADRFLERLIERAGGNPLFIEEILKTLVEAKDLLQTDDVWRLDDAVEDLDVPDTIESVLTTRIDGLDAGTKRVLQYAAIVGRRFWSGVIADALARRPVDRELDGLLQAEFVRALPHSAVTGDREFTFEHLLLQEVAYEGMLRRSRSELHGSVAEWLERRLSGDAPESDEWIAFHFLRSNEAHRAAPYLERAARAARAQGALADAQALVERALALATEPRLKADLLLLAEQLAAEAGDVAGRLGTIENLEAVADQTGDPRIVAEARYRRACYLVDGGDPSAARAAAHLALEGFEGLGDVSEQGDVLRILGRVAHLTGNFPEALRFYRSSLAMEREAGDRHGQAEVFDRLGLVQADLGSYTTGLDYIAAAHEIYRELGDRLGESRVIAHRAAALRLLGQYEAAEEAARAALELTERCGSRQAHCGASLALAATLAARGERAAAAELYRETGEHAGELRQPALESLAWLGLAEVQSGEEARESIARARRLARAKGLTHVEILALARLAVVDLDAGDLAGAAEASGEAMRLLDLLGSIQGPEEAVLWARYRVAAALGREEEAREALVRARTIITNRAERIEDAEMRSVYLHGIELNAAILTTTSDDQMRAST